MKEPTMTPSRPIRLYTHPLSGHAHRVALMLALLGLPFERIEVDLMKGAHRSPDFLAKNPFGQIPVIEDGDLVLPDSNAILTYLALKYDRSGTWLPRDPESAAEVQRWLSVAAGPLVNGPMSARLVVLLGARLDHERCKTIAQQLYTILDAHLAGRRFLVGNGPTIADVALYSYTAVAPEGGIALQPYAHVQAWLAGIEALPGFLPMQRTHVAA
jgi:glutathione S-transferase